MTQGPRAKTCDTHCPNGRTRNLPEIIRVKEAAPACELLFGSDKVAPREVRVHLSTADEAEARRAALALGEVY